MEKDFNYKAAILRQKAEELLKMGSSNSASPISEADVLKLIQELGILQIELELQNTELELARSAAQAHADKHIEIYDSTPSGFFTLSKDGRIIELNINGAIMLGKERPNLKNSRFDFFISDDTRPDFDLFLKKVFKSKSKETCMVSLSINENVPMHVIITGIVTGNGSQCHVTVVDISESKQAEESLKASEARYRRLFESAKDGILILDAETGMITDVNPFLIELLGYSVDQFLNKAIWEIGLFKDIVSNQENFSELQMKEYVRYDNLPLETADGRKMNVEFVSNVYFEGKKKVVQCNIRDITKRKHTELALHNSETQIRTLVQTIPDLIWLKDTEGAYLSCNPMFERFFGAVEADIVGKTDYDFVDREQADFFRMNDQLAITAGKPISNEEWVTFADDGHRIFLDTIKTPMYDSEGTLLGILGIGRDITARNFAEKKVADSENRFRSIFNQAPIAMALIDFQGHPIISNSPLSKMMGYSSKELSKLKFTEFTYPEDIDKDMKQFTDLLNGKISGYSMEKRYVHKNGNLIWGNLFVTTLCNENGMPNEIIGMIEDITERKRDEINLRHSEEKFRSYIDHAPDGVFVIDETGRFIDANNAACMVSGHTRSEVLKMSILDMLAEESLIEGITLFNKLIQQGTSKGDLSFKHKDGVNRWGSLDGVKLTETRFLVFSKDITERKQAEEEITILSHSLKSINECISITDLDNNILFVNESFVQTYGYDIDELIGSNISIVRSQSNEQKRIDEILPATILGEWHGELLNRRKDGSEFPIYLSTTIIKDKESKVLGLIGVSSDITERKLAEKELIEAKEKAEESDRLKSAFLANMSHEVRTPLNSIIGFSELLNDPDFGVDQKNEFIQHIINNGNNLLNIISDILDISKMESGEFKIRKKQISALKFISAVKERFSFQAEAKKMELTLTLPEITNEIIITADTDRLSQVFNNLISNAFKFTARGSIEIGYLVKGKMVEFFVRDTGIGIPASHFGTIFERFKQVELGSTRNYGGNGLGLAITKNLVELMGGEIWLESEIDKGSVFYFTLPIHNTGIQ